MKKLLVLLMALSLSLSSCVQEDDFLTCAEIRAEVTAKYEALIAPYIEGVNFFDPIEAASVNWAEVIRLLEQKEAELDALGCGLQD